MLESKDGILTNDEKICSLSDYLTYIQEFKEKWKESHLWFRGVSNETYELIPSIYRESVWKYSNSKALSFFREFRRRERPFSDYDNKKLWEIYQTMQHYGAPTRLLDWTAGSLIGLFFAIYRLDKSNNNKTPCVWILDPKKLNKFSYGQEVIMYTESYNVNAKDEDKKNVSKYLYDNLKLPPNPIAILPFFSNKRIVSQKSVFTIHGKTKDGLEKLSKDNNLKIGKITIDKKYVSELKKELFSTGISNSSIFPDLEGLARELKSEWNMK